MLVGTSGASATSFIVVLFVLINVLLILLHKGTFSKIRKKIYAFTQQLICFIYLITSSIRLRIFPCELLGFRVFYISGIMLFLSILLTVINTVGLIKTNKRAKNASCLKEDVVWSTFYEGLFLYNICFSYGKFIDICTLTIWHHRGDALWL